MPGPTIRFFNRSDAIEIIRIPLLMIASWVVPERHWDIAAGMIARWISRLPTQHLRVQRQRLRHLYNGRLEAAQMRAIDTDLIVHQHVAWMRGLREYRPGTRHSDITVAGTEHVDAALANGDGVVLWVTPFVYSHLATKKVMHEAGYRVSHLSRSSHGFSSSRFGYQFLNPIWTRIEDRYLAERVRLDNDAGPAAALTVLRQRLRENRIVSITVTRYARKTAAVAFLNAELRLPTGPGRLARATRAPLLPIFAVRTDSGGLEVTIGSPLGGDGADGGGDPVMAIMQNYVKQLEPYALRYPSQWGRELGP